MTFSTLLLVLYVCLTLLGWIGISLYQRRRRQFLREVAPIFKAHLGFVWEPLTWRDRLFYPLDGYKLKMVKAHVDLVPAALIVRYQHLSRILLWSYLSLGLSFVIVFVGHTIVRWFAG